MVCLVFFLIEASLIGIESKSAAVPSHKFGGPGWELAKLVYFLRLA